MVNAAMTSSFDNKTGKYGATDNSSESPENKPNPALPDESVAEDDILVEHRLSDEKTKIWKDVFVVAISCMFQQTAFQSMERLQSSINPDKGMGAYSIAAIYAASIPCNIFFCTLIIKKLTVKWTIVLTQLGYSFYIAAQFWPRFYTLLPTAIVLGFCSAPCGVSRRTYLIRVGNVYAEKTGDNVDLIVNKFFSVFFVFLHSSSIWGNIIASTVLGRSKSDFANRTDDDFSMCGASFCADFADASNNSNLEPPPTSEIYILSSVYLGSALLAVAIMAIFLNPLSRWHDEANTEDARSGLDFLSETVKQMKLPLQLLLIPLSVWGGLQQGFLFSEYTRAYISCAYGTENIGYVLIVFGCCNSVFPIVLNPLVSCCGRIPIFIFGALCNATGIALMVFWQPHPNDTVMFYGISAIWGVANAIWQTQINALYGILFRGNEEASFSVYGLCIALGWLLAFLLNNVVCTFPHLCVVTAFLIVGMIGYFVIEVLHRYTPRNGYEQLENGDT